MVQVMEKIFGKHSVRAAFLSRPQDIKRLIIAGKEDYLSEFIKLAKKQGIQPEFMEWKDFRKIGKFTEEDKHQGIFVFAEPRKIYDEKDMSELEEARCVLVLDQITNPQNLATILRGAGFFGIDAVVLMKDRAVDVSPVVTRYAVGGAEFTKIFRVTNLSQALTDLKQMGFWVYGLDERGQGTLASESFAERSAFVVGAEGEGLRPKTRKYCDILLRIPGGREGLESLNAGVATTIAMYEMQRLKA
jgi:23S rRNA (guanosine2251-2'-O)-methyltransferase